MTIKTISAQGIDLHRHELPQRDMPAEGSSNNAESTPFSYARDGFVVHVSVDGVNALVDVANKHAITPEAMKDILTATLTAFNFKPEREFELDEDGVPVAKFDF